MTRRLFFATVPLLGRTPSVTGIGGRAVVVINDVSPSYKHTSPLIARQKEIVSKLGPNDDLKIIELGGEFSPDKVKVQCTMPAPPTGVLAPVKRPSDLITNQARLTAIWAAVDTKAGLVSRYLDTPVQTKSPTPLFETLAYVAENLATSHATERYLAIFSDMVHASGGVSTPLPPATMRCNFAGVTVMVLFVPWRAGFTKYAAAWRKWFIEDCHACAFAMLDSAQSQVAAIIPPSAVPRLLTQRF